MRGSQYTSEKPDFGCLVVDSVAEKFGLLRPNPPKTHEQEFGVRHQIPLEFAFVGRSGGLLEMAS